jgi:DNA-binding transcriptional ArsR family regulator
MEMAIEPFLAQLKALADPVRLRLVALCRHGECSVSELTEILGQSQPRVSQHLKQLCDAGLLERFRDGKRVYYRVPLLKGGTAGRRLLELIPEDRLALADTERLRRLRGRAAPPDAEAGEEAVTDRAVHRALLDLTITAPLGDLLDIGCGRGRTLKLLASRANRAVGVDTDATARQLARSELMLAGLPNCSLRQGDMYQLPFADGEFDTIILDDVLADAARPVRALVEAKRLLRGGGRLIVLLRLGMRPPAELQQSLAAWSAAAGLRLGPARLVPKKAPAWSLSVATTAQDHIAAA